MLTYFGRREMRSEEYTFEKDAAPQRVKKLPTRRGGSCRRDRERCLRSGGVAKVRSRSCERVLPQGFDGILYRDERVCKLCTGSNYPWGVFISDKALRVSYEPLVKDLDADPYRANGWTIDDVLVGLANRVHHFATFGVETRYQAARAESTNVYGSTPSNPWRSSSEWEDQSGMYYGGMGMASSTC